jgi:predicted RNA-binding Zn-ribbon protein involved in translation (DUF1610 family)
MKKKTRIEAGTCPKCGEQGNLNYGDSRLDDELLGYDFDCPDCGATGVEWHRLEFSSFAVLNPKTQKYESFDA